MKKVYVSSTYQDLLDYRSAVFRALRKMRCDAMGMEDYPAKDQRTVARYGHIPEEGNPEKRSMTDLEYRQARSSGKTCLLFLLDDTAAWSPQWMDCHTGEAEAGGRIKQFRTELKKYSPASFRSPDDLAAQVTAAVYQDESTARVARIESFNDNEIDRVPMGESGVPNIQERILGSKETEVVEITLAAGEAWWSTRLYLVAALATDFTKIQQLVFTAYDLPISYLGGTGPARDHFVGMYSPADVRHALARKFPEVETAYLHSLKAIDDEADWNLTGAVSRVLQNFGLQMLELSDGKGEASIKIWVDEHNLKGWMMRAQNAGMVERTGQPPALLQHQILSCHSAFVALVEPGKQIQVVDRLKMATNIAKAVLEQNFM